MGKSFKEKRDAFLAKMYDLTKSFTSRQFGYFVWLSAARALPFLGIKEGFKYWAEADRQKHLLSVFYAVDVACLNIVTDGINARTSSTVSYLANVAASAADDTAANYVASAASRATNPFGVSTSSYINVACAAYDAAKSSIAVSLVHIDNMANTIIDDIINIRTNNLHQFNNDTSIYGGIWYDFLADLKDAGCEYWANLYENLFTSGFIVDKAKLERRINVPDEIKAKGAAAVGKYLEGLGDDIEQLNEARIIILGEKGAGKTSLARKLLDINAEMPKDFESTEGVVTSIWSFPDKDGDKNINAHIWDFAGHSITHSAHRCFMSARCLYIYVYNGRIERDNDPEYWLEQIRLHGSNSHGDTSPVMFLINEVDNHNADIAENTLKEDYPSIVDYYHVNIGNEDTSQLEGFRENVMDLVRGNISWSSQIISKEAYAIKAELRDLFKNEKNPYISRETFNEIANRNNVTIKRTEEILSDLHALGICLWYGETEMEKFNALVLNPDWIADGIYRIINRRHKDKKHILNIDYAVKVLKNHERHKYPPNMVEYLFHLMRLYELAFFTDENKDQIFVPGILSKDRPDDLPKFAYDDLTMSFEVKKALPSNIVCRVIVQRNEEIFDEKLLWRKGAVLKYKNGDTIALIKEDGLRIVVDVKGNDRTAYISELRGTLRNIFEDYKGIKPDLKYKILFSEDVKEELRQIPGQTIQPLFEPVEKIIAHAKANVPILEPTTLAQIPAGSIVNIYNIINVAYAPEGDAFAGTGDVNNAQNTFHNCVFTLQGELNNLADKLNKKGFTEDAEYFKDIVEAVEKTQAIVDSTPNSDQVADDLKKKGILSKLKEFVEDITDKNPELRQNIEKVRNGAEKVKSVLKVYNEFAKVIPVLPQVPDIFLKE